jgi:hypothetical protein
VQTCRSSLLCERRRDTAAAIWLAVGLIGLSAYARALDPLPGEWQLVTQLVGHEVGSVVRVEFDSVACEYTGRLVTLTDSMRSQAWFRGDVKWWGFRYGGPECTSLFFGGLGYEGYVTVHQAAWLTPDSQRIVDKDCFCILDVLTLEHGGKRDGWFSRVAGDTALLVVWNDFIQEVWCKVARENQGKSAH